MLCILAHSIKENNRQLERAPSSDPANNQFFLPRTNGFIEHSAIELSSPKVEF